MYVRWLPRFKCLRARSPGRRLLGALGIFVCFFWILVTVLNNQASIVMPLNNEEIALISQYFAIKWDAFYNLHQYSYSLQSHQCQEKPVHTVVVVHSKPSFLEKREVIRATLSRIKMVKGSPLAVIFMLGQVTDATLQSNIMLESRENGDMVQGNYLDDYTNMTHKHIMTMHWILNFCHKAQIIVKIDDDVIVNPFYLWNYTRRPEFTRHELHCPILLTERPIRTQGHKYFVPYDQYPFPLFPEYCPGFAYVTTVDVYRKLYNMSRDVRFMNMDDVYVTGLLAMRSGVTRVNIWPVVYQCSLYSILFKDYVANEHMFVLNEKGCCQRKAKDIFHEFVIEDKN